MRIGGSCPAAIHGAGGGVLVRCMVRTCTGEVWVRRSLRSPVTGSGLKKKVSCISRAGCLGGKFSAVKLWKSSSMSGPSATEKPMSAKMETISSMVCMVGCTAPLAARRRGQGQVHPLGGELGVEGGGFERGLALGDQGGDAVAQAVDLRPFGLALVRGHRPEGLEQARYGARLAQGGHTHGVEHSEVAGCSDLGGEGGFKGSEVGHGLHLSHLSPCGRGRGPARQSWEGEGSCSAGRGVVATPHPPTPPAASRAPPSPARGEG